MDYNVEVSEDAQQDLDSFIKYLIYDKCSQQAAMNVLQDYCETVSTLSWLAGSLKYCNSEYLAGLGYKRLRFRRHRYFLLYRIEDETAIVDNIFHELQDYEKHLM